MADLTEQDAKTLQGDLAEMDKAGMSAEDKAAYADEFMASRGHAPTTEQPLGQLGLSGAKSAALFAGPAIGGALGASMAAGRNALPFLGGLGRLLTQYGGETLGIAGGDVAARALTGTPQNYKESAGLGLGSATIGEVIRGATQAGGRLATLPKSVPRSAAKPVSIPASPKVQLPAWMGNMRVGTPEIPLPIPNLSRVAEAGPFTEREIMSGISPEDTLAVRAGAAAKQANNTLTADRIAKNAILAQADAAGTLIPTHEITKALGQHSPSSGAMQVSDFRLLNNKINQFTRMLDVESGGTGYLKPSKVDEIIRKVFRPKSWTGTGNKSSSLIGEAVGDAETAATNELNRWLPGDLASKNAEISKRLKEVDDAVRVFGDPDRAGVTAKIATAFAPNNESTVRALNVLKVHDPTIVEDARKLYVQRQFAGDPRGVQMSGQGGYFGALVRGPSEYISRITAPWQRVGGGLAAGAARNKIIAGSRWAYRQSGAKKLTDLIEPSFKRLGDAIEGRSDTEQGQR